MIITDLWDAAGPSPADLNVLERLGRHRRAFEAVKPADEHQATVRERLLSLLDDMEETLCEEGRSAPALAEGWQRVDELEARFWQERPRSGNPSLRPGFPAQPRRARRPSWRTRKAFAVNRPEAA